MPKWSYSLNLYRPVAITRVIAFGACVMSTLLLPLLPLGFAVIQQGVGFNISASSVTRFASWLFYFPQIVFPYFHLCDIRTGHRRLSELQAGTFSVLQWLLVSLFAGRAGRKLKLGYFFILAFAAIVAIGLAVVVTLQIMHVGLCFEGL